MRILIVGGGKVAEELLYFIDPKKHQVYVVEKNPERRQDLMSRFDVYVIGKDATDISLYTSDIKLDQIDMVIALTSNDEVNLLVLAIAKIYNVPYRIARVTNRKVAELIRSLELGIPVSQPTIIASAIKNYIDATVNALRLATVTLTSPRPGSSGKVNRNYHLYLITLSENDVVCGAKIGKLELPEDTRILLVFDGEGFKPPNPDEELKPGYQLVVLSSLENIEEYFKG
ncbi:MAG: potassium transporter TrkA [Thermoprotei archaeon]|nr:MAG: potassium transporter TrkA [Thermoprotei archaeon]